MNVSLSTDPRRLTAANHADAKTEASNGKAARDFEAMLLAPLLDSLQKSFAGDNDGKTPGAGDYRQMGTQALAQALAVRGGIGLAQFVLRHLSAPRVPGGG
jgi:Rod binding domain-containing protein